MNHPVEALQRGGLERAGVRIPADVAGPGRGPPEPRDLVAAIRQERNQRAAHQP